MQSEPLEKEEELARISEVFEKIEWLRRKAKEMLITPNMSFELRRRKTLEYWRNLIEQAKHVHHYTIFFFA
jgi:hypothetical protein